MLKSIAMQRVTLYMLQEDAPLVALTLAECGVFNPVQEHKQGELLPEHPGRRFRELFAKAQMRLEKILEHLGMQPDVRTLAPAGVTDEVGLAGLNEGLGELWRECSNAEESLRMLQDEADQVEQLGAALDNYAALDINLGWLQGDFRFLDVHVGTVPADNVKRLRDAVGLIDYTLTTFLWRDNTVHVVIAGLAGAESQLQTVSSAAAFRPLELPPEFHDHPTKVREELARRRQGIVDQQARLRQEIEQRRQRHEPRVTAAAQALMVAAPYARLADVLRGRGGLAQVSGWVPADRVDYLRQALCTRLKERCLLEARDPTLAERSLIPSAFRHPWLVRPFAALVKNYGVPRYGEVDPTWLFAVTFVAMFGMMFGDVGHGAVIALVGATLRHRLSGFAPFVVAGGISSTAFGFLYGSVFGYEELIHPLWIAPLSDPNLMLTVALGWGIAFVLLATAITIRNRVAEGRIADALLDGNGLAGAALYVGVLFSVYRWIDQASFGLLEKAAILVPLAVILGYKWREIRAPAGERALVAFIEGFETFIGYIANTLSFLRVAAFSLNHVALAVALFTLADMMGAAGHWITVVLGNLFILVLEGAIVAIQVLRLEYYEGFSRFFSGDGREFQPLTLEKRAPARAGLSNVRVS